MSPRTKSYLFLFIATVIWGIAGPVIKYTERFIPSLIFLLYRLAIAAGVGLVALAVTKHHNWPKSTGQQAAIVVYGFLTTTVSLGLLFVGYETTSALTASILSALYPIMVAIVGMLFLHERVTRRENVGMGIALLGTAVVTLEPLLTHSATSSSALLGNLLIIGSLVVGVIITVMAKLILRHSVNPISLTHLSFIIGFVTLAPFVLSKFPLSTIIHSIQSAPLGAHLGVVYMALASGTIAYSLWDIGQKTIEIGESALFNCLLPVITLPLSIFWLHEDITTSLVLGTIVTAAGVIVAEMKKHR